MSKKLVNIALLLFSLICFQYAGAAEKYGTVNLVKNPHFSDSLKHYSTQYLQYNSSLNPEGTYVITDNPKKNMDKYTAQKDHTQDSAKLMFFVNSGIYPIDSGYILSQTVSGLRKGEKYRLGFWASPNSEKNLAIFKFVINSQVLVDSLIIKYAGAGIWRDYEMFVDSLRSDTLSFTIYTLSKARVGNDLGLDDFSLTKLCDDSFDFIDTLRMCSGSEVSYDMNFGRYSPNYRFKWDASSRIDTTNPNKPVFRNSKSQFFFFTIFDDIYGCKYRDSIFVEVFDGIPVNAITASNNAVICPCEPVILSLPTGYSYKWSNGATTNAISVNQPGKYSVIISTSNNCQKSLEINVSSFSPIIKIKIDSLSAKIGEDIDIPINYQFVNYDSNSSCKNITLAVQLEYKKSLILPKELMKYRIYSDADIERLKIPLPAAKQVDNVFNLQCKALFGSYECTDIKLSPADSCMQYYSLELKKGKLCISDLCKEPTIRLVSDDTNSVLPKVRIKCENDFLRVQYSLSNHTDQMKQTNRLTIFDALGRELISQSIGDTSKDGEILINFSNYPRGIYFYTFVSSGQVQVGRFYLISVQ